MHSQVVTPQKTFPNTRTCAAAKQVHDKLTPLNSLCRTCILELAKPLKKKLEISVLCADCQQIVGKLLNIPVKTPKKVVVVEAKPVVRKIVMKLQDKAAVPKRLAKLKEETLPSLFTKLNDIKADWCRYCGCTEDEKWSRGPWGERTLCQQHGTTKKIKGSKIPLIDLRKFLHEVRNDRIWPILKEYCFRCLCNNDKNVLNNSKLLMCHGCPKSFHSSCVDSESEVKDGSRWYCSDTCRFNESIGKIVSDFPILKDMPFYINSRKKWERRTEELRLNILRKAAASSAASRRRSEIQELSAWEAPLTDFRTSISIDKEASIQVPTFCVLEQSSTKKRRPLSEIEDLADDVFSKRHKKYQDYEKHSRILRPGSLASLQLSRSFHTK